MKVVLHHTASKYYSRLPKPWKTQVKNAIDGLEKEPPEGDIMPYEGNSGISRLKTGKYRVLFKKIENEIILVTHIEPRGQAYTKKTRKRRG